MSTWVWFGVLLVAVWAAHWGAEHLSKPLKKLRKQWGFSVAAGGALVGLTAASPEIAINVSSAITGSAGIGLGVMLGSNILAIPMMVIVAYFATRKKNLKEGNSHHEMHLKTNFIKVEPEAVTVQAIPYLGIIALLAVLTVPKAWRGLQPVDGWIMLGAYVVYLAQALLRGGKRERKGRLEKERSLAGCRRCGCSCY